jgi:hypothetical protein
VLKPDVVVGNVYHAPHHSAQLLRGEFNDPSRQLLNLAILATGISAAIANLGN